MYRDIIIERANKESSVEHGDGEATPMETIVRRNKMKNEYHRDELQKMLKNDKCSDIFKNVKQNQSEYEVISYKDALNHKFAVKRYNMTLNRLKMVINMKLAKGDVFIKLVL